MSIGHFLFDINRGIEKKISAEADSLTTIIRKLHQDVWNIFSKAKGQKLEQLLKGEIL